MMMRGAKKGQAAMEYLTTYGWALLVIVLVIALLLILFSPAPQKQCLFEQVGLLCSTPITPIVGADGVLGGFLTNGFNEPIILKKVLCTDDRGTPDINLAQNVSLFISPIGAKESRDIRRIITADPPYLVNCTFAKGGTYSSNSLFQGKLHLWFKYASDPPSMPLRLMSANLVAEITSANLSICTCDGSCSSSENWITCPCDCHCGNGICENGTGAPDYGESSATCSLDCGSGSGLPPECATRCGDGLCDAGPTCNEPVNCPSDCPPSGPACTVSIGDPVTEPATWAGHCGAAGHETCEGECGENPGNCPADCSGCPFPIGDPVTDPANWATHCDNSADTDPSTGTAPYCNGLCNENPDNCPADCPAGEYCLLDGICDAINGERPGHCADCTCDHNNECVPQHEDAVFCDDCGCNNNGLCDRTYWPPCAIRTRREGVTDSAFPSWGSSVVVRQWYACTPDCYCDSPGDGVCDCHEINLGCPDCSTHPCNHNGTCDPGESYSWCDDCRQCDEDSATTSDDDNICQLGEAYAELYLGADCDDCGCDTDGTCDADRRETNDNATHELTFQCADCYTCNNNGVCDYTSLGETENNCPSDCGCTVNGACEEDKGECGGALHPCPPWGGYYCLDCSCGDGTCQGDHGETISNCPSDCFLSGGCPAGHCGNDVCEGWCYESSSSCPLDCDPCPGDATCGDGTCQGQCDENPTSCPADCAGTISPCSTPGGVCGDEICEIGLDCNEPVTCPADCDFCHIDGYCNLAGGETFTNCPADCTLAHCNPTDPLSPDRACQPQYGENASNCVDCVAVCGNDVCEASAGETEAICPADCGCYVDGICEPQRLECCPYVGAGCPSGSYACAADCCY